MVNIEDSAVSGIPEGAVDGLLSIPKLAYDIATNPESYFAAGIKMILAFDEINNDNFIIDTDKLESNAKERKKHIDAFIAKIGQKCEESDRRDITKAIFKFTTEAFVSGKIFQISGKLAKVVGIKGVVLAKDVKSIFTNIGKTVVEVFENPALVTEGFVAPIGVAKEIVKDGATVVEGVVAKEGVKDTLGALENVVAKTEQVIEYDGIDKTLVETFSDKSSAKLPYSRALPETLEEQMAMKQVMSNPNPHSNGATMLTTRMSDTKNGWTAEHGWIKVAKNISVFNTRGELVEIEIHYLWNEYLNVFDDFKFKLL